MAKFVALIGYPLQHSVSPSFQQAAFDYCQLDVRYEKWETEARDLEQAMDRLRRPSALGANVTVPYKEKVLPLLDELDDVAARIGAVNTIVCQEGRLLGFNTDAAGFLRAVRRDGGFEPRDKSAVVVGAGGAARAVGFALAQEGARRLTIVNRTLERAEALAAALSEDATLATEIVVQPWELLGVGEVLAHCDLLVNCTSVGMRYSASESTGMVEARSIPRNVLVCDLVYNPIETRLLREAKRAGARVVEGLAMLVYQGADSFEKWTGRVAPVDIMYERARQALS